MKTKSIDAAWQRKSIKNDDKSDGRKSIAWDRVRDRFVLLSLYLGLVCITFTNSALAQDRGQIQNMLVRTLTVSGRGVESIPTTLTEVRLGVEVQRKTITEAQQEAARRSDAVVSLLKARPQVEKLQTTGITLNPVYSYNNNTQKLTGYIATNTVSFRVPTEKIGMLLDETVKVGATRIDGINFVATDSAVSAAQQLALRKATQDAQQQANSVLSSLNLTPKEIVSIQVNDANVPPPQPLFQAERATSLAADAKVATPVVGGEQKVEASVTLQISY
ncbi:SIMPL domain-containing protein [Aliterella atlantica]|uniref:SIMPL domain-containing protein n=1 Tax=Aliterella atlantica TaxID=1827278 RepID=UPI0009E29CF7|nr:SIMPL domain-containing protein [Aliterella atlantica]